MEPLKTIRGRGLLIPEGGKVYEIIFRYSFYGHQRQCLNSQIFTAFAKLRREL